MNGDNFWFNLMVANAILAIFNLIPAFPMDGGRVLRVLLALNMDKAKATNIAARIGQTLAIFFVFLGFFTNFWLVFIGFFIYLGAGGEVSYERQKASFRGLKAKDVMLTRLPVLSSNMEIGEAVKDALASQDRLFFVESEGCITGLINFKELLEASAGNSHEKVIEQVIDSGVTSVEEHTDLNTAVGLLSHFLHIQFTLVDWVKLDKEKEKNYPGTLKQIGLAKNELNQWEKRAKDLGLKVNTFLTFDNGQDHNH